MSSVRLYVLAAFARHGELHGHQLRLLAERANVHLWTDVSVGSLYQAIKRMAGEGLLRQVRTEQQGGYPPRQVFALTDEGLVVLRELQRDELRRVRVRTDPFDLALSRLDPDRIQELPEVVQARLAELRSVLAASREQRAEVQETLSAAERWAFDHYLHRLQAEISWSEKLSAGVAEIVAGEQRGVGGSLPAATS